MDKLNKTNKQELNKTSGGVDIKGDGKHIETEKVFIMCCNCKKFPPEGKVIYDNYEAARPRLQELVENIQCYNCLDNTYWIVEPAE